MTAKQVKKSMRMYRKAGLKRWSGLTKGIKKRPLTSFFAALGVLLLVLVGAKIWGTPSVEEQLTQAEAKPVPIFQIGEVPTLEVRAKIEKTGVVTIMAQTAGVVGSINAEEGRRVNKGQVLVNLVSTYAGANSASVQRQIAERNFQANKDNLELQLELVNKRREVAEKTEENSQEQRELSRESLKRTRNSLNLNEDILETLETNLELLQNTSPEDGQAILAAQQLKAQSLSAVNGLREAVDSLEYATDEEGLPVALAELGKEITLKGLELEERGYRLGLEISGLNLKLAKIGEAIYYPQAPFAGTVERVYVKPGQLVQPGTPLMALAGSEQSMKAVALVSGDVAAKVGRLEKSRIYLPGGIIEQTPQYISSEPTDGNLYAITWCDLDTFSNQLGNGDYVRVEIPVGYQNSLTTVPFIPIDSVYQTQDAAYVFVMEADAEDGTGVAQSREVDLGLVYGSYVQVKNGLVSGDRIILDRKVVTGNKVKSIH